MANKIWIACYDCGETHQVEVMERYTARQICSKCKDERAVRWQKMLEKENDKNNS